MLKQKAHTCNPCLGQICGNVDRGGYDAGTEGPLSQFLDMIDCILQNSHGVHFMADIVRCERT